MAEKISCWTRLICLFAILFFLGTGEGWTQQPGPKSQSSPGATPVQDISQVRMGMTSEEVRQVLGPPREMKSRRGLVEWEYHTPQGKYEIKFQNDRVVEIERY